MEPHFIYKRNPCHISNTMSDNVPNMSEKLLQEFNANSYEEWKAAAEKLLKGAPFDKKMLTRTPEGITLQPIYRQDDVAGKEQRHGMPGMGNTMRGATPDGYTIEPWAIAQEIPYGTPEAFNRALLTDLMRGQNAVNVTLDIATHNGKDPDTAKVGEVGACGLSLASIDDFEVAFKDVIPDAVRFYFQSGTSALPLAALFFAWLGRKGRKASCVKGGLGCDPLATLVSAGTLPQTLSVAYNQMAALTSYTAANAPGFAAIGVSVLPHASAGASAVEELACALATGVEYMRELQQRGISVDVTASQMLFTFALGPNFFMEVAKLRAARLLWAKVIEAFGGNESARTMRIHGRTTLWNKTVHDPYVNMLRTSIEALSGAVGGVQSMHVGQFDECLRVPTEFSRRIARNSQIMLQEECELTGVIDPAGGSWYIESLTDELAQKAWAFFQEIEAAGGATKALESGLIQQKITAVRNDRLKRIGTRQQGLIGTNLFPNLEEKPLQGGEAVSFPEIKERRAKQIGEYRTSNDESGDRSVMEQLAKIASQHDSLQMEILVEAASSGATLGEISASLRPEAEKLPCVERLPSVRASKYYEELRAAASAYKLEHGHLPQIFLANIGPLKRHKPRMDFTTGFFATGGFEFIVGPGDTDPTEAAKAADESGAPITVICGTDDDYVEFVPAFCREMKRIDGRVKLVLAGYPGDNEGTYKAAGLDDYIFVKSPNYDLNKRYLEELGVL